MRGGQGYPDGTFRLIMQITRAEAIALLMAKKKSKFILIHLTTRRETS